MQGKGNSNLLLVVAKLGFQFSRTGKGCPDEDRELSQLIMVYRYHLPIRHAAEAGYRLSVLTGLLTGLLLLILAASAAGGDSAHHPANVTLFYPAGTNQDPDISTSFRLSLIYGRVGEIRGVDLNAGVSIIQRDLRGLQATLLYSQVGGYFGGVALTGLVNYFQGENRGLQVAGLTNFDRGHFRGVQYAGLFNFTGNSFHGAQISNVFNANQGEGGFLQLAGVANMNDGDFRGIQLAGINFTGGRFTGVQLAAVNMALEAKGIQGGLINLGGQVEGIQIAALNIHRQNDGIPVGFINIAEDNGGEDWVTFGSNLAAINTGLRTTVNRYYSMITAGYGDLQGDIDETGFLTWNFGYAAPLNRKWTLNFDLGYVHIMPQKSDDPNENDRMHWALQGRVLAEVRLSPKLAIFGGGGISSIWSEFSSDAEQETEPLGVLGISAF